MPCELYPSGLRRPLAAAIAACVAAAAFSSPCRAASFDNVLNCNDDGSGSLRDTIKNAGSGDTVVLNPSSMHCSSITLTGGEIGVGQQDLYIKYNADNANRFTISGNFSETNIHARIFNHTGGGTLKLERLHLEDGGFSTNDTTQSLLGGCIDSAGVVDLESSTVTGCTLAAELGLTFFVRGGGVYAAKGLILNGSTISDNRAANYYSAIQNGVPQPGAAVEGVGAFANGFVTARYSTVSGNYAYSVADNSAGGGIFLDNTNPSNATVIQQSTISGNAALRGGGVLAANFDSALTIENSTISGNTSYEQDRAGQAAYARGTAIFSFGELTIRNSTIAFNTTASPGSPAIFLAKPSYAAGFVSTIVADNTAAGDKYGVGAKSAITISGAYNLIQATAPSVTFTFAPMTGDPLLLQLGGNGGPTQTQAFRTGSPVFGAGNNAGGLANDQRGSGFARQAANGAVDIGAYQLQIRDRIFADGFDST
ncbi:MAG TPA: choice-of-anchor Q domain-containing protein [Rudaea sp.]|jgi:hypothetical protein